MPSYSAMIGTLPKAEILSLVLRFTFVSAATYLSIRWIFNKIDPTKQNKTQAKKQAQQQLKRISETTNTPIPIDKLTDYEMMIATHLVHPDDISVTWNDIGGLEGVIQELRETVIFPIQRQDLFADSELTQPPKGVLLHGPPGCGKTLIAKATAKEAGMTFINLDVSILTDKWYGESQKLAAAVFTLATKLQPCIVFIDEIDSFLRMRTSTDHEATAMMKAQFMSFWDGLITNSKCTVIIMGATNRPQDLDRAILRRMPATFNIPLPNIQQREKILRLILQNEPLSADLNFESIIKKCDGFSGSDLRELCRNAALYRVREYMNNSTTSGNESAQTNQNLRPINIADLIKSLNKMRESKLQCGTLPLRRIDLD